MGVHEKMTGAQRTARHRAAKRAQGFRLKQIWLTDLSNPEILERIRRDVVEINRRDRESGVMAEIEALGDEMINSLPPCDWDNEPHQ